MKLAKRRLMRGVRAMAYALAGLWPAASAGAADMSSCEAFQWSLASEQEAFAAPSLDAISSGATPGPLHEQAFTLRLAPQQRVAFKVAPGGRSHAEGDKVYAGIVTFEAAARPGVYQVTLSDEGWIDIVENGALLVSVAHTGAKDCPGLRKSVRFAIGAAPVTLQVSGVPADVVKIAIRAVKD